MHYFTPRFNQITGARFLAENKRAILADIQRFGKTGQAVMALDIARHERATIVAPANAVLKWADALPRWQKMPRDVATLGPKSTAEEIASADILVASYNQAVTHAGALAARDCAVIFDEAHKLKNPETERTIALLGEDCSGQQGIARGNDIYFLTGTPSKNNSYELFPLLRACGVYKGTATQFLKRFCNYYHSDYGIKITGTKVHQQHILNEMLAKCMLRRTERDDKHGIEFRTVEIRPDEKLADLLRRMDNDLAAAFISGEIGMEDERLSTYVRLSGLAKAPAIIRHAKQYLNLLPSNKLVLMCWHRDVIEMYCRELKAYGAITFTGSDNQKKRFEKEKQFETDFHTRVAVCQIIASGEAVDFSAANTLFMAEKSWSPKDNEQAYMRIMGPAQRAPCVHVVDFILHNSLDQAVAKVCYRKARNIGALIPA